MNRKELINEYKQTIQPMGIYQIKNMVNGKIFLGGSEDLKGIINRNKFQLKSRYSSGCSRYHGLHQS